MNLRAHPIPCLLATLLFLAAAGLLSLAVEPAAQTAKLEIPKSTFVYPATPQEGRDPFFPDSQRVYGSGTEDSTHGPSLTELTLRSILGTPPRVFAVINNHTFAAGDEGDVMTKTGQRLHIHCVDINLKAGTATVEANGISDELHLSGAP